MDEMLQYAIGKNPETGFIEIYPMNPENTIIIHGIEEAVFFITHILDYFRNGQKGEDG